MTFNGDAQKCDTVCDVQSGGGPKNNVFMWVSFFWKFQPRQLFRFSGGIQRTRELQLPCEWCLFFFPAVNGCLTMFAAEAEEVWWAELNYLRVSRRFGPCVSGC